VSLPHGQFNQRIVACLAECASLWGTPELPSVVNIMLTRRLRSSLGRSRPAQKTVSLNLNALERDPSRLEEVLCHELAHIAVHLRCGPSAKPHGQEWADLVKMAGVAPRVRALSTDPLPARRTQASRPFYEHRCPVCQTVRYARRPVASWRCAECLDTGLSGEMVITRHDPMESTNCG